LKLFFDENLSEKLPLHLAKEYPGSSHPRLCGLAGEIMATRDKDLPDLAKILGAPPKVIWLRFHNPSTKVIANALRINLEQVEAFAASHESVLIIQQRLGP
jgi:predicted nuclease of predicted toxin-antitoxin system